jgi:hypothetical protein
VSMAVSPPDGRKTIVIIVTGVTILEKSMA